MSNTMAVAVSVGMEDESSTANRSGSGRGQGRPFRWLDRAAKRSPLPDCQAWERLEMISALHEVNPCRPLSRDSLERGRILLPVQGVAELKVGEWAAGSAPGCIEARVESGVCLTLWHPFERIGAACHFEQPEPSRPEHDDDPRYASVALRLIFSQLRQAGITPRSCTAKVFAGAPMMEGQPFSGELHSVAFAQAILARHEIPSGTGDVGRSGRMQIRFDFASGEVWVRRDRGD